MAVYSGWKGSSTNFSFYWKYSRDQLVKRKGFGEKLNKKFIDIFYEYSWAYTPEDTGNMFRRVRKSANDTSATLTYLTVYAKYQHDRPYHHPKYPKPLATMDWDAITWINHRNQIIRELNAYRKKLSTP